MAVWGVGGGGKYQGGDEVEVRGTDEQPLSDKLISHRWYDVEKLKVSGSSNLKAQHKVLP